MYYTYLTQKIFKYWNLLSSHYSVQYKGLLYLLTKLTGKVDPLSVIWLPNTDYGRKDYSWRIDRTNGQKTVDYTKIILTNIFVMYKWRFPLFSLMSILKKTPDFR